MGSASALSEKIFGRRNTPIIQSVIDTDLYKLMMMQFVWFYFRSIVVRYGFHNRSKRVFLLEDVPLELLKRELDHVTTLRLTEQELKYLRGLQRPSNSQPYFFSLFLRWFQTLQLPPCEITADASGRNPRIEVEATWPEMILWEIFILSVVNQLRNEGVMARQGITPEHAFMAGEGKLDDKIQFYKERPYLRMVEFGTRRRASFGWQLHIDGRLSSELPPTQFLGTSNVYNAMLLGITPQGTKAHELDMVTTALASIQGPEAMRANIWEMVHLWFEMYGVDLSIGLGDTYGEQWYYDHMPEQVARNWKGERHDSGDLIVSAQRQLAVYQKYDIDARAKLSLPSDGLDCQRHDRFHRFVDERMLVVAGIGTYLSNDIIWDPVSIVVKPIGVRVGEKLIPTCKLSNNPAKAQGETAEFYKKVFDYSPEAYEECRY
jgi:nicotinate phosphoribosyltransferase